MKFGQKVFVGVCMNVCTVVGKTRAKENVDPFVQNDLKIAKKKKKWH